MSRMDNIRRRLPGGPGAERVPRSQRKGPSNFRIGLIALIVIAIGTYFGFAKALPFGGGYELKATFKNASNIKPNSPVRIAGVNVGKVTGTETAEDSDASVVTMQIKDNGLPIHQDAVLKIRPRIFLEGNFFVDLSPGTPSAPTLDSGSTVDLSQTGTSVQLDEVLTALQRPTRGDLQTLLQEFSKGLADGGAEGLNQSFKYSGNAFKNSSIVNKALQGEQPNDLSKLIRGQQRVFAALDRNEVQLKDLITNFNITNAALASQSANLTATVRELPRVLAIARPALFNLNIALPATRELAKALIPGLQATPATVNAAIDSGWITQTRKLLSQQELQGLAAQLQPTVASAASTTASSIKFLPQANNVSLCFSKVLLPAGDIKIQANNGYPANLVSGAENYKEFWYSLVGLSGEGASFDGNGQLTRFQTGGGATQYTWGKQNQVGDQQFANGLVAPVASRPSYPGKPPPFKSNVPCYKNPLPSVNGAQVTAAAAGKTVSPGGSKKPRRAQPNSIEGPLTKSLPGVDSPQQPVVPKQNNGSSVLGDLVGLLNPFGRLR